VTHYLIPFGEIILLKWILMQNVRLWTEFSRLRIKCRPDPIKGQEIHDLLSDC
jgi:hypothetical protein